MDTVVEIQYATAAFYMKSSEESSKKKSPVEWEHSRYLTVSPSQAIT